MKISNEIKAKVFAGYLGRDWFLGIRVTYNFSHRELYEWVESEWKDDVKLVLKPLSEITDEDAYEIENIHLRGDIQDKEYMIKYGREYAMRVKNKEADIYQFLQSKGYDLPHYLLGGKTLKEAGLAIYESDSK